MLKRLKAIGPGALAAAAFIGPGTVTTATVAGATYGYSLAWALVFATLAAIALQEMAMRVGIVSRKGLGEAVLSVLDSAPAIKWAMAILIIAALYIGNAAYEGGNIAGAALGVEAAVGEAAPRSAAVIAIACIAGALLWFGGYKVIERALVAVVIAMSICFLTAAIIVRPDISALAHGIAIPSLPNGSLMVALGLIGTTIVPYNLFLHAAAARTKWSGAEFLGDARFDATLSIGAGGVVSLLILTTAAASLFATGITIASAADMARQLEPAFGSLATWLLALGLFAAGLTSAITAPLATAYAASEIFGLESQPSGLSFRLIALSVLIVGVTTALAGKQPVELILFAQFANGLLLPVIAVFLLYAVNRRQLLGAYANGLAMNVIGVLVILITAALGVRALLRVANAV